VGPAPDWPGPGPRPGAEQNAVGQLAYQWRGGQGSLLTQRQSASQVNTTVQIVYVPPSLTADLQAAPGWSPGTTSEAVNQTAQGIWQLQIGCLIFCVETEQYQQAEQSNTTIQVLTQPASPSLASGGAVVNLATALVWQVQVGCLFWCWDATQVQILALQSTQVVIEGQGAPSQPSPKAPSPPWAPSPPQTPWPTG